MMRSFLRKGVWRLGTPVSLLMAALLLLFLVTGVSNVSDSAASKQLSQLNNTVRRYAVQCYALEGQYPESVEYLSARYGLALDTRHFVYHYRYLGANIMPEIAVLALTGE
jgi:hypothetical protein